MLAISFQANFVIGCFTTYRPNYFVHSAESPDSVRQYHSGVPQYLEVSDRAYVESSLIELFRNQMAFSQ